MTSARPKADRRPKATLSLDLDNLWCYQRSFGIESWRDYASFLDLALPKALDLLDHHGLRLTAFVIGRDALQPTNRSALAEITKHGHEAGNHSFDHQLDLHRWPRERIKDEIGHAGSAIAEATGQQPRGFRSPAYGLSSTLLEVLAELGYAYDASSCPSSLGLLARFYHRRQAARLGNQPEIAEGLYGSLKTCRLPLRPYRWDLTKVSVTEAPVTTLPFLRLPFQGTYLNFLADRSPKLAFAYFRAALRLCRLYRVPPSFLLHATDVLGNDDLPEVTYLPGMKRSGAEKRAFLSDLLAIYGQAFQVQPIGALIDDLSSHQPLRLLSPAFES